MPGEALRRCLAFAALASIVVLAGGCKAFDETLLNDAGTTVCVATPPPERPAMGEGDGPERVFALRDVELDQQTTAWQQIGWDRDGICTRPPDFETECRPPIDEDGIEEDGDDGIDNVFGHEVTRLATIFGFDVQESFRAYEVLGIRTTLVRVRGWNGAPNDSGVDVTVAAGAFGTVPDPSGDPPPLPPDGSPPPPPAWDGMDYFWADEAAFVGGDENMPVIRDDRAYVRDGLLVVSPPDRSTFVIAAEDKSLTVTLTDAVLTAQISETGLANVILAGRWDAADLLGALESFGACPGTDDHPRFARLLEIQADLRATPGSGGPGVTCNALSTGIRFQGLPVRWAGLSTAPPLVDACE